MTTGSRVKNTGWPMVAGNGGYGDLGTVLQVFGKTVLIRWDFGSKSIEHKTDVTLIE